MPIVENFPVRSSGAAEIAPRSPPQNLEAEQALLGAIIINNDAFDRVSDFLKAEHFHEPVVAGVMLREIGDHAAPVGIGRDAGPRAVDQDQRIAPTCLGPRLDVIGADAANINAQADFRIF